MAGIETPCLECRSRNTFVVLTTRIEDGTIIRRRCCKACGHRWYTQQQPEIPLSKHLLKWSRRDKACSWRKTEEGAAQDGQHSGD